MHLHCPTARSSSAVIFNALIIVALIPLALRGVKYPPIGAAAAPAQPAHLRPGRRDRPVHRDQAHRHAARGDPPDELKDDDEGHLSTAIRMTILTAILLGPRSCWRSPAIAQVVFPGAAIGSPVKADGQVVGSSLIAQEFTPASTSTPVPRRPAGLRRDGVGRLQPRPTSPALSTRYRAGADSARIPGCRERRSRSTWSPPPAAASTPTSRSRTRRPGPARARAARG